MPAVECRPCVPILVPPGADGLRLLLPQLRSALAGTGPAIAPLPRDCPAPLRERLVRALAPTMPVPAGVAAVLATSGSTAQPRGVLLPASAIAAAAAGLGTATQRHPGGHRWVAALPLHSAGGFMVAARGVLAGTSPVPLGGLGGARPFAWEDLRDAADTAGKLSEVDGMPLAVSLVPAMLARVAEAGAAGIGLLARFDLVLVGGSAADAALLRELRAAGVSVRVSYGMTETCGGAVIDGVAFPGVRVRADAAGRLCVAGSQVALGYRGGERRQDWSTDARGLREFRTGDLGEVADGQVRLAGRTDDVVQVGGASVSLGAVRAVLLTDAEVADAQVVALPDEVWGASLVAFVVLRAEAAWAALGHLRKPGDPSGGPEAEPGDPDGGREGRLAAHVAGAQGHALLGATAHPVQGISLPPLIVARLVGAVGTSLGMPARPRRLLALPEIPLLPAGKPDRLALARLAATEAAAARGGGAASEGRPREGRIAP